jgi:molecular chaperone DnaK
VDADTRKKIEEGLEALKKAMEGSDADEIKKKSEELAQASHKLAEAMYAKAQAAEGAAPEEGAAGPKDSGPDDVVDAEFEEVDDSKK